MSRNLHMPGTNGRYMISLMEHEIFYYLKLTGEPNSPRFTVTINSQVTGAGSAQEFAQAIAEHLKHSVRSGAHQFSPTDIGINQLHFEAPDAASRPRSIRAVLEMMASMINPANEKMPCLSLSCKNSCRDPITTQKIDLAVHAFDDPQAVKDSTQRVRH
jgi:hypothetical protein